MPVQPYLFFNGRCEEAVNFYAKALGTTIDMMARFKESPEPHSPGMVPAGWEDKIMHASFKVSGTLVMASDGLPTQGDTFKGFALSISCPASESDKYFNALVEGGTVQMPLTKTFWSPRFGMLTDKFGVMWMISAE
jgi:PhnB protein